MATVRLVWYPAQPRVDRGVPYCVYTCREHTGDDGCRLTGLTADRHCAPAVVAMADALAKLGVAAEAP